MEKATETVASANKETARLRRGSELYSLTVARQSGCLLLFLLAAPRLRRPGPSSPFEESPGATCMSASGERFAVLLQRRRQGLVAGGASCQNDRRRRAQQSAEGWLAPTMLWANRAGWR